MSAKARRRLSITLTALATIVAVIAALGSWADRQLLNTDNWVDTSTELLSDPAIVDATSAYLADQLVSGPEVTARLREDLPPSLTGLAAPLSAGAGELAQRAAHRLISSGAFIRLWRESNRRAHEQLLAIIDDDNGRNARAGVVLDLRPQLGVLASRIGVTATPESERKGIVRILRGDTLDTVRSAVDILRTVRWVSLALLLALLVGAVALAPDRARGLMGIGLALIVAGLLLLVARRVGGHAVVDALSDAGANQAAAKSTWTIATSMLADIAGAGVVLGVVLTAAGWVGGMSKSGRRVRAWIAPAVSGWPEVTYAVVLGLTVALVAAGLLPASGSILALLLYLVLAVVGVVALRRRVTEELAA